MNGIHAAIPRSVKSSSILTTLKKSVVTGRQFSTCRRFLGSVAANAIRAPETTIRRKAMECAGGTRQTDLMPSLVALVREFIMSCRSSYRADPNLSPEERAARGCN